MRSRNEVRSVGNSNAGPPKLAHGVSPKIGGFGLKASTPRMATKANRQAHSRQLYRPSAFESEANRTTRQDAYTHSRLGVRRTHKGIATTADHIWIARNRGKFILIPRVDSTQPVLFGWSGNDAG